MGMSDPTRCLRCEIYGVAPDAPPSLSVFFHVAALAETANILSEQLGVLQQSGLMQWADRSYATVAGWDGGGQVRAYANQLRAAGFKQVIEERDLSEWEFPTV